MSSSQHKEKDIVLSIYQSSRTVFRLNDIAMIAGITNFQSLNKRLNYYVQTGKLLNPRKGIYAIPEYSREELSCSVFRPAYISLEYVMQQAGIVFQYDSSISAVSYLSREIEIEKQTYRYRKIKKEILINTDGIKQKDNLNIAVPERAFIDLLYLEKEYYFDNLSPLKNKRVYKLLPFYQSDALTRRVTNILEND